MFAAVLQICATLWSFMLFAVFLCSCYCNFFAVNKKAVEFGVEDKKSGGPAN